MVAHLDWVCGHHLFNSFQISRPWRSRPLLISVWHSSLWIEGSLYGVARSSRWGSAAQGQTYKIMPNPGGVQPDRGLSLLDPLFTKGTNPKNISSGGEKIEKMNLSIPTGHDLKF